MNKSYIVIIRRAWCNEGGHGIEYSSDLIHYETRNGAISHGFRAVDSDDFNVGVIEGGKLISFDWMGSPVGESEDTLAQISELIGLERAA
ncbi:TPA: antitoxin [Klebsiella pneumoniae]|nr:antitoxin [Klebsiella pneumoniae]